jgi:transposase
MKYIGIDAHSSTCEMSVKDKEGVEIDHARIETNGRLLVDYMRRIEGPKKIVFEESEISHWLYGLFRDEVDEVVVCNPVVNARYKDKKTDKYDASKLADLLRGKFVCGVYHDGSERERFRVLMSGYEDLIGDMIRVKNRYKSLFRKKGLSIRGESVYGKKEWLEKLGGGDERFIGEQLFQTIEQLEEERQGYVGRITIRSRRFKEIKYLRTLTGIGVIQAAKIVGQVVDPRRFGSKHKYWSYCGLARHKQISGGRTYGNKKSHGNLTLKCVYKMAAHQAIRSKGRMRDFYEALRLKGVNHEEAKNAVSRKIAAISLHLWKYGEVYDEKKLKG